MEKENVCVFCGEKPGTFRNGLLSSACTGVKTSFPPHWVHWGRWFSASLIRSIRSLSFSGSSASPRIKARRHLSASSSSRSSFSQDLQAGCHVLPHWTVVLRNVPGFSPQNTHTFSFSICDSPLCALKSKVTGTLEGQISMISFDQHTILTSGNVQLHTVTTIHLECNIVTG